METPWTDDNVNSLTERQKCNFMHEYSCAVCGDTLEPTNEGWVCTNCGWTQHWCFDCDADWQWKDQVDYITGLFDESQDDFIK